MKALAIILLCLSGCTTISTVNVGIKNASESAQLDKVCKLRPIAVAAFDLLRSQVEISDAIVSKVYLASAAIKTVCTDRPEDIGQALVTVTRLYGDILASQTTVSLAVANKLETAND